MGRIENKSHNDIEEEDSPESSDEQQHKLNEIYQRMMKSINAIGRNDLDRIRSMSSSDESRDQYSSRREQLKQLSDSRVAGWEDTLTAKRKAKLEWKAEKAKKEEHHQQALDAEEASLQQLARIKSLQHADSLLLEQSDRVRNFRSQQLLVETLNERDEQIKQKAETRKKNIEEEKLWHRVIMDDIASSEQKRKIELARERQKSIELANDLAMQRQEREKQLRLENQRKQQEEKNMIQQIARESKAAEKAEFQKKLQRKEKAKTEMRQNEMILLQKREADLRREQEETRRCEEELERRIKMSGARSRLEEDHFRQKQATRKLLSDRASQDLKQRAEREYEIFERDRQLKQQKVMEQIEAARKEKEMERHEIEKSRMEQLKAKKQQAEGKRSFLLAFFLT
jgi:hypothetical protein